MQNLPQAVEFAIRLPKDQNATVLTSKNWRFHRKMYFLIVLKTFLKTVYEDLRVSPLWPIFPFYPMRYYSTARAKEISFSSGRIPMRHSRMPFSWIFLVCILQSGFGSECFIKVNAVPTLKSSFGKAWDESNSLMN